MPRVNIYIRNDDWEKWEAIGDVPSWIHDHLNQKPSVNTETPRSLKKSPAKDPGLCEHFQPKGQCLQVDCKSNK